MNNFSCFGLPSRPLTGAIRYERLIRTRPVGEFINRIDLNRSSYCTPLSNNIGLDLYLIENCVCLFCTSEIY